MTRTDAPGYAPVTRDVVAARERLDAGPDQDALCWCNAAWGARKTGSGRWNVDEDVDEDEFGPSDGVVQDAYVIAPLYGRAYLSQHREQGCEGSKFL